jgi:hypothetical protein
VSEVDPVADSVQRRAGRRRPHQRSFAPNARAPACAPNQTKKTKLKRNGDVGQPPPRRRQRVALIAGRSADRARRVGARLTHAREISASKVYAASVQCCFDRVVSEVDPVADSVQRRAGRRRPHQRSFAPNARAPACAPNQTKKTKLKRNGDVGQPPPRRRQRVALIAGRSADRARRVGARLTHAREISASKVYAASVQCCFDRVVSEVDPVADSVQRRAGRRRPHQRSFAPNARAPACAPNQTKKTKLKRNGDVGQPPPRRRQRVALIAGRSADRARRVGARLTHAREISASKVYAASVQCCFDRVVSEVDPVADSVQRRAGRRRPHQRSFAPNARAPACAPNQTKKTKLKRNGDVGQPPPRRRQRVALIAGRSADRARRVGARLTHAREISASKVYAASVQCCFDRVVSEVDPVADSVQRRAGRRRPHQRSFAPNARAPACAPNQTKKTKLKRNGDVGQPPPRRRQRVALIAGRSADRARRVGARLTHAREISASKVYAASVQCCFDRVVSEVDPVADSVQRRAGRRRPHQRSFAPNARAPACAPNQTKKTKLKRNGDVGQPPPRRRQRVALIAGRSADRARRVGARLTHAREISASKVYAASVQCCFDRVVSEVDPVADSVQRRAGRRRPHQRSFAPNARAPACAPNQTKKTKLKRNGDVGQPPPRRRQRVALIAGRSADRARRVGARLTHAREISASKVYAASVQCCFDRVVSEVDPVADSVQRRAGRRRPHQRSFAPNARAPACAPNQTKKTKLKRNGDVGQPPPRRRQRVALIAGRSADRARRVGARLTHAREISASKVYAASVQCCFDRVVSEVDPVADSVQRRAGRRRPHQRSFAPNARAPACAPNQTKKTKLKRNGDVGQPPPRRRQRVALIAGRSADRARRVGARLTHAREISASKVYAASVQCCFDRVVSEVDPVADSVQRRAGRRRPHQRSFAPNARAPACAPNQTKKTKLKRNGDVGQPPPRRRQRVALIAGRSADRARRVGARLTHAREISASKVYAASVQCCFDRVVSEVDPVADSVQRRAGRRRPHQRSFAPNARAPACAPNQTKKTKLKRNGDVGQPPPRRRQRVALIAGRSADRARRVGARLTHAREISASKVYAASVQCCFDRVVSEVDPVADSVQRRAGRRRPHQRSFAPNARAPACAPNQTKKTKLKRNGDVGQPPPRRRQRVALIAGRSADRARRVGARLTHAREISASKVYAENGIGLGG